MCSKNPFINKLSSKPDFISKENFSYYLKKIQQFPTQNFRSLGLSQLITAIFTVGFIINIMSDSTDISHLEKLNSRVKYVVCNIFKKSKYKQRYSRRMDQIKFVEDSL